MEDRFRLRQDELSVSAAKISASCGLEDVCTGGVRPTTVNLGHGVGLMTFSIFCGLVISAMMLLLAWYLERKDLEPRRGVKKEPLNDCCGEDHHLDLINSEEDFFH